MRLECAENEKTSTINVLMGVFFDDHNIKHNIDYYRNQKEKDNRSKFVAWKDSDETGYSNVVHLYNAYKHTLDGNPVGVFNYVRRVYTSISDNHENEAAGRIDPVDVLRKEIISKVQKGCEKVYRDLGYIVDVASEIKPIEKVNLSLDVYGAGSGAAVARCFLNCLNETHSNIGEEKTSLISYWFEQLGYECTQDEKVDVSVEVRFVGLYDTVASCKGDDDIDFNNVLDLGLDGGNFSVDKGVHFCAANEYRSNYSLVSTDSYSENIVQYFFPGTHHDICGGYKRLVRERLMMNQIFKTIRFDGDHPTELNEVPNHLKEGWCFKSEDSEGNIIEPYREVLNTYSLVFLFLMLSQTVEGGFGGMIDQNALKVTREILADDTFMEEVQQRMNLVVDGKPLYSLYGQNKCDLGKTDLEFLPRFREDDLNGELVRRLRGRYIHLPSYIVLDPITHKLKIRTILKG